jgi:hypothetical protein
VKPDKEMIMTTKTKVDPWEYENLYWDYMIDGKGEEFLSLWDEEFRGWPQQDEEPIDYEYVKTVMVPAFYQVESGMKRLFKQEAVVNERFFITLYAAAYSFTYKSGATVKTKVRITHTWRKGTAGKWRIIGGMSSVPSKLHPLGKSTGGDKKM